MNHIEQAYEQGLRIREEGWYKTFWIKKYSDTHAVDELNCIWEINAADFDFEKHHEKWEIWHEDLPLFTKTDIKAQIQTHLNQIQELLKQL